MLFRAASYDNSYFLYHIQSKLFSAIPFFLHRTMAGQGVKIKWSDHLNSSWVGEKPESVCHRETAESLYARLIGSKVRQRHRRGGEEVACLLKKMSRMCLQK